MTRQELEDLNTELVELLTTLRTQIDAKLDELDVAAEEGDDEDGDDD